MHEHLDMVLIIHDIVTISRLARPDEATYAQNEFSVHRNDAYGSCPITHEGTWFVHLIATMRTAPQYYVGNKNLVYHELESFSRTADAIIDPHYELPKISRQNLSLKSIIREGNMLF